MAKTRMRPAAVLKPSIEFSSEPTRSAAIASESRLYLALLAIAPLLIYLVNHNWTFQGLGHMDNWYYAGMFTVPLSYEPDMHNYALERLSWNIPGHLLTMLFPAPVGGMLLNFISHAAGLVLVFLLTRRFTDARTGFLTASLMALHPLYIGSNGWNYLNGASNVYMLLAYWALAASASETHPRRYWLLAGVAWSCLVNGYIAWIMFTPTCLLFWMAGEGRNPSAYLGREGIRRMFAPIAYFGLGFAGLFAALALLFRVLVPNTMHPFFYYNVYWATRLGNAESNPWSRGNFSWIHDATWIVTPIITALFAIGFLWFRRSTLNVAARCAIWAFLFSFGIMIVFTLRQTRLLEFDYFASILLPTSYLALGVTAFRIPSWVSKTTLMSTAAACAFVMGLGLLSPGFHLRWLQYGIAIPLYVLTSALLLSLLWRARSSWLGVALLYALGTFPLVPSYTSAAYLQRFDGRSAYGRVADAVRAIEAKHRADGRNQAALLWINNNDDPYTPEFRAIMCGFMAHKISMWDYPRIDEARARRLRKGDLLTVLTSTENLDPQAMAALDTLGFSTEPAERIRIARGDGVYWITFLRIRSVKS